MELVKAVAEEPGKVVTEEPGKVVAEEPGKVEVKNRTAAGEDMVAAVTVSFCLYPHQGLLLFVLHP